MTVPPEQVAGPLVSTLDGPATVDAVKALYRVATNADDDLIAAAVAAANAYVARLPYAQTDPPTDPPSWPADVVYGANLLAGRAYRRKNSPGGVETVTDLGGAVYAVRNDPDIAQFLGTGAYARPIVG